MSNTTRRPLDLSPRQWQRLEQLAVETDSRERPSRGHDTRVVTWQRMIRRIADGELHLVDPHPYALPAGLAEQAAIVSAAAGASLLGGGRDEVEERQRETAARARQRKTPVRMEQLSILDLEPA